VQGWEGGGRNGSNTHTKWSGSPCALCMALSQRRLGTPASSESHEDDGDPGHVFTEAPSPLLLHGSLIMASSSGGATRWPACDIRYALAHAHLHIAHLGGRVGMACFGHDDHVDSPDAAPPPPPPASRRPQHQTTAPAASGHITAAIASRRQLRRPQAVQPPPPPPRIASSSSSFAASSSWLAAGNRLFCGVGGSKGAWPSGYKGL
jgi:hypothetical protein